MVGTTSIKTLAMAMLSVASALPATKNVSASGAIVNISEDEKRITTTPGAIPEGGLLIGEGEPSPDGPVLYSRQSGVYITTTNKVGDGNPHQVPWAQQISQNQGCGSASQCTVGVSYEHTLTYGWSVGVGYEWISGGFSVEESFSDGETHECTANKGQTVCVWRIYNYTAYTVTNQKCYYFNGAASNCVTSGSYVLSSPNKCQRGPYYCKIGSQCTWDGDGFWKPNTGFGGPPC
ncbi:hypothetical protein F5X97DRAFT_345724 [Nemania serpens]|nr:hypothetical protein F5X97DRAFT_345724 [Nemania serpens]